MVHRVTARSRGYACCRAVGTVILLVTSRVGQPDAKVASARVTRCGIHPCSGARRTEQRIDYPQAHIGRALLVFLVAPRGGYFLQVSLRCFIAVTSSSPASPSFSWSSPGSGSTGVPVMLTVWPTCLASGTVVLFTS